VNALTTEGDLPPFAPHCAILLDAVAGVNYRIAVAGGPQDGGYGPFQLDIHRLEVPVNDDFSKATTLALKSSGSIKGTAVDATEEDSEPSHDAGSYESGTVSVWYRWKATSRQPVILSACSNTEPVRIAVYTGGTVAEIEQVAASETGCPAGSTGGKLAIAPVAGVTYRIAVAAGLRDAEGPFLPPKNGSNLKAAIRKCRKLGRKPSGPTASARTGGRRWCPSVRASSTLPPRRSASPRPGAGRSCCGSMPARGKCEAVSPDRGAGSYVAWCGGWQL